MLRSSDLSKYYKTINSTNQIPLYWKGVPWTSCLFRFETGSHDAALAALEFWIYFYLKYVRGLNFYFCQYWRLSSAPRVDAILQGQWRPVRLALLRMLRINNCCVPSRKWNTRITTLRLTEEQQKKRREVCMTLLNQQQLWLHRSDLSKSRPVPWKGKVLMCPTTPLRIYS